MFRSEFFAGRHLYSKIVKSVPIPWHLMDGNPGFPWLPGLQPLRQRSVGIKNVDTNRAAVPYVSDYDVTYSGRIHDVDEIEFHGTVFKARSMNSHLSSYLLYWRTCVDHDVSASLVGGGTVSYGLPLTMDLPAVRLSVAKQCNQACHGRDTDATENPFDVFGNEVHSLRSLASLKLPI